MQAFPCHQGNQAATFRGLENLVIRIYISKEMICKTGQKDMTLNGGSISLKAAGLVEEEKWNTKAAY